MTQNPHLTLLGGLVFGAGITLGVYVLALQFASPLVALVPTLLVAGMVLALAGMDLSTDDDPPSADDLEDSDR